MTHHLSLISASLASLALVLASGAAACSKPSPEPEVASHGDEHAHGDQNAQAHADHQHGEHHGPLVHRFEKAEDWAASLDAPERDAWQKPDQVVAQMAIEPGMTVADIGAGTGYFLPHLSRAVGAGGTVLGLDIEQDMVRYMTERAARENLANVQARQVPGDDPQLAAGSVDRILIVNTWHHIPDRERYAARLASALRPGGAIHVVDYTLETERGPPKKHRLAPDLVARELASAGLTTETRSDVLPEQYIIVARRGE